MQNFIGLFKFKVVNVYPERNKVHLGEHNLQTNFKPKLQERDEKKNLSLLGRNKASL